MEIQLETNIDKPPQEIYEFLLDKENIGLWLSNFKQYKSISGDGDEVGDRAWYFFYFNKANFKFEQELTNLIPDRQIEFVLRHPYVDINFDIQIKPEEAEHSMVRLTTNYLPKSPLFNLYWFARSGHLRKRHARDLNNLHVLLSGLEPVFEIPQEDQ